MRLHRWQTFAGNQMLSEGPMSCLEPCCTPSRSRAEDGKKILLPVSASFLSMKLTGKHLYCPENVPPASPPKNPPNMLPFSKVTLKLTGLCPQASESRTERYCHADAGECQCNDKCLPAPRSSHAHCQLDATVDLTSTVP